MAKNKRFSVTVNRNFMATISVTVDVSASSEDEAKEIAIQMAKANEIESEHYNLDGLHAQGAEVIYSDSFDGEPEVADVSDAVDDKPLET